LTFQKSVTNQRGQSRNEWMYALFSTRAWSSKIQPPVTAGTNTSAPATATPMVMATATAIGSRERFRPPILAEEPGRAED
jgi:hypothetical protein